MKCSFCNEEFKKNAKVITILTGYYLNGEHISYNDSIPESLHICENDWNLRIEALLSVSNKDGWKP
jgi:hypothetical protein